MEVGAINVAIGATVEAAGFDKAVSALGGIEGAAAAAAAGATSSLNQIGAAADAAAARYVDAGGRLREANGRFVSAATLAAEAAAKNGGSLGNLSDMAGSAASSINGKLVKALQEYDKALAPLDAGIGRVGQATKELGQGLTVGVTLPLTALAAGAVKTAGDMQALEKGFAATYKGSEDLGQALVKVQELAKLPGLGLQEALQGATNLQAAGFSADLARRALGAFGNALATVGKGKTDLDGVGLALGQIASKGKISAEEINQLAERVPQIRGAIQAAFGTSDTQALQKLNIDATTFVEGITAELEKLPKVTGGINNAFENLADVGTTSLAKLGDSLNKAFDIEGIVDSLSSVISGAATAFSNLSPATQKVLFGLAGVAAAAGPVLFAIGSIGAALPAITAGFSALGITSVAALGPILPIAAAVAAAAYLIIDNWAAVTAYFGPSGEGGRLFGDLAESVTNSVKQIGEAFGGLGKLGSNNLGGLVSASGVFSDLFRGIAVGLRSLSDVIGGLIGAIVNLFKGQFSEAASQAGRALLGLIDPLTNLFGFTRQAERSTTTFGEFFKEIITQSEAAKESIDLLAGGDIAGSQRTIGVLAELREQLKLLNQEREDALTNDAAKAFNPQIADVEKQIAALEGSTKKGKDALADLTKALADNGRQSIAAGTGYAYLFNQGGKLVDLGNNYDYLGNQQKIVENGIKSLIAAGYDPAGATVGRYVAKLRELNMVLGDNELLTLRAAKNVPELFKTPEFKLQVPEKVELPEILPLDLSSLDVDAESLGAAYDRLRQLQAGFNDDFTTEQARFNDQIAALAEAFPAEALSNIGEAVGGAIANGTDALEAAGKSFLKSLADLGAQFGKYLIALGIANLSVPGAQALGIAQIVGGTGLVIAAGVLGSFAGSGGGGGGAGSSIAAQPRANLGSSGTRSQMGSINITGELVGRGKDLVAVVRAQDYRALRSG